ncbi:MAG: hypothetical protein JXB29_03080 [Sedimentisphaerales bacterium]|nr:hypothetical protein [Sedimentisphaerales bacterium]
MAKQSKNEQNSQLKHAEFTIVTFAKDSEQAREYETLLKDNDIPVLTKDSDANDLQDKGIAIMVPEEFLDEAHVIIEAQDAYDDFYDFTLEDDDDFDSELFNDEP